MTLADVVAPTGHGQRTPDGRRLLGACVRGAGRRLGAAAALLSIHQLCEIAVPVLVGVIVDAAIARSDAAALAAWLGVIAAVFVVLTIGYRMGARLAMRAAQDQAHQLRMACSAAGITDSPDARPTGEVLSLANADADETGNVLRYLPQTAAAMIALLASAATLVAVDPLLGLSVLIGVPVIGSVVLIAAPVVTRRVGAQQHYIGRATALASDFITGLRPLRGLGAHDVAVERYRHASEQAHQAMRQAATGHGIYFGTATGVSGVVAVAAASVTGWFALTDRISLGAFIAVLGIAQFLTEPLAVAAMFPGRWATARASAERIAGFLWTSHPSPDERGASKTSRVWPHPTGEFIVVGSSTPTAARRFIDLLDDQQPPDRLLIEPHTVDIFAGSLLDNLFPRGAADSERALYTLAALGCEDIFSMAPADPLTLEISERGYSLSGGQRQRVALVRALLTDPAVLVLQDPTTAVDSITEQTIVDAVRRLRHSNAHTDPRTTIVVTNSETWRARADRYICAGEVIDDDAAARMPSTAGSAR